MRHVVRTKSAKLRRRSLPPYRRTIGDITYRLSWIPEYTHTHTEARSYKLNKEEAIPSLFPPFPLEVGPFPRLQLSGLGEHLSSPSGSRQSPATKRICAFENASSDNILGSFTWSRYTQYHRSYNEEAIAFLCLNIATDLTLTCSSLYSLHKTGVVGGVV